MGLLENGLAELGIQPDADQMRRLESYIAELELWNPKYGLANADGDDLIVRHILDSLTGLKSIRGLNPRTLADVGSGAGLPGIPLAIFLPRVQIILVERSGRRAGFLRNAVVALGLTNVDVREQDIRDVDETFDVMTFRAFTPLEPTLTLTMLSLLNPGGWLVAYKGRRDRIGSELDLIGEGTVESSVLPVHVPRLDEERHLVILRAAG